MIDEYLSQEVTSRVEPYHGDPSHLKSVGLARSRPLVVSESTFSPPLTHWPGTPPASRLDTGLTMCRRNAPWMSALPSRAAPGPRVSWRDRRRRGPGMTDVDLSTCASWSALSSCLLAIEGAATPVWRLSSGPPLHPSDPGACERPPRMPQFHRRYPQLSRAPRRA